MNENENQQFIKHIRSESEELREDLMGLPINDFNLVGDFGCGWGYVTYSLAQEIPASKCIGIDKFDPADPPTLNTGFSLENIRSWFMGINAENPPEFRQGNIVSGENLPFGFDLIYCKRVMYNIFLTGDETELSQAINHIVQALRPSGWFSLVEIYESRFKTVLEEILIQANFAFLHPRYVRRPYKTLLKDYDTYPYLIYQCQKGEFHEI